MAAEREDQQESIHSPAELNGLLSRLGKNVDVKLQTSGGKTVEVKREKGEKFIVNIDPSKFNDASFDSISAKAISQIEALEMEAKLVNDGIYGREIATYRERCADKPAFGLFYQTIFQAIAIHKGAIHIPILREKLANIGRKALESLPVPPNNIPLHIQFLLALMGVREGIDDRVLGSIHDLESAGILGRIFHIQTEDGDRMQLINEDVFIQYEYFWRVDFRQWRKKIKKPPEEEEVQKEVQEQVEDVQKQAEEVQEQVEEEAPEQPEEDQEHPEEGQEHREEEQAQPEGDQSQGDEEPQEQHEGEPGEGGDQGEAGEAQEQPEGDQGQPEERGSEGTGSEGGDEGGGSSGDSAESTPDNQERDTTPEGGSFEEDPDRKGYSLEVFPFLRGYYINNRKSKLDLQNKEWVYSPIYSNYDKNPKFTGEKHTISGTIAGAGMKSIPLPNGYALDINSLQCTGDTPNIFRDQNGNFFFRIKCKCEFSIDFYKEYSPAQHNPTPEDTEQLYQGGLSPKAEQALQKAILSKGDPSKQAEIVRSYIRRNHFYPSGKTDKDRLNAAKKAQGDLKKASTAATYIQTIDSAKYIECYSANTLMAAMLRRIGVPCRVATGHHIESPDDEGKGIISTSNAHGWCEIWDGTKWSRFDATPPEDPSEKKKEDDGKKKQEGDEGKKGEEKDEDGDEKDGEGKKEQPKSEDADDGGHDTPSEEDEEGDEGGEGSEGKGGKKDGGEDGEKGKKDGDKGKDVEGKEGDGKEGGEGKEEGEEGDGEEGGDEDGQDGDKDKDSGKESGSSQKGGQGGSGETKDAEYEDVDDFDPEEEFKKMYDELQEHTAETPDKRDVEEAVEQMEQERFDLEQQERERNKDAAQKAIERKFPQLPPEEQERLAGFVRNFLKECDRMSEIPNPDAAEDMENPMLIDALKSILKRVISRSLIPEQIPRFPVADGDELYDPVGLWAAERDGDTEPQVWMRTDIEYREKLTSVKLRRHKILDASGSMESWYGGEKLTTQQLIEVLENRAMAEYQEELETLSGQLGRDVRIETETWQFGVADPQTGLGFRLLKNLSPEMDLLDQAITWHCAGQTGPYGTNDYDPLETIYSRLVQESQAQKTEAPDDPTVLERVKAGFCVRELKTLKDYEARIERGEDEEKLSAEEMSHYQNIEHNRGYFEQYLEELEAKYGNNVEPIIEVVEVSTDGGSGNLGRVQQAITKLRGLGVIVVAYGLGNDGYAVETTYANQYNPLEGGIFCRNILEYPRKKLDAWKRMLDKI